VTRARLPNRRHGRAARIAAANGAELHVRFNVDAAGQAREIFIRPRGRTDTDLNDCLDVMAIMASLLLQWGETPAGLARRFAAAAGPAPAALVAGLQWAAAAEAEFGRGEARP
jgi:hypothetical protein